MKSIIGFTACALAISSAYAGDEKSKMTVAKLDGKTQVAATMSKTKPAHSTPAVATESPICDYSVETDCR